ncbi:MAG: hypothetical protein KAJ47_02430, partial [Candidatus Aenigmarchaeota archaeon]|nr:hypothetical protein [Candidatus Aenigmarchaeota archaeon]
YTNDTTPILNATESETNPNIMWYYVDNLFNYTGTTSATTFETNIYWYRLPVNISAGSYDRLNYVIETDINFTDALDDLGVSGTFDQNSVRVIEYDSSYNALYEVPSQLENYSSEGNGTVVWIMNGTTTSGTTRYYKVFFDIEENGLKSDPGYEDTVDMTYISDAINYIEMNNTKISSKYQNKTKAGIGSTWIIGGSGEELLQGGSSRTQFFSGCFNTGYCWYDARYILDYTIYDLGPIHKILEVRTNQYRNSTHYTNIYINYSIYHNQQWIRADLNWTASSNSYGFSPSGHGPMTEYGNEFDDTTDSTYWAESYNDSKPYYGEGVGIANLLYSVGTGTRIGVNSPAISAGSSLEFSYWTVFRNDDYTTGDMYNDISSPATISQGTANSGLSDGQHTITVYSSDLAGNTESQSQSFTIDTIIPKIDFVDPTPDDNNYNPYTYTYINATITDTNKGSSFIDWNKSLVGWYRFDNATDLLDHSTYLNDGTNSGSTYEEIGKFGGARAFDEIDNNIVISDFGGSFDTLSLSFWFKDSSTTGSDFEYIFSWGTVSASNSINIYFGEDSSAIPNTLRTSINDAGESGQYVDVSGANIYVDGNWHLYTLVKNTSGTYVYIDGNYKISSGVGDGSINPSIDIYIGGRYDSDPNRFYGGYLDEIMLINRSISEEEINASYNNSLYRLEANITGLAEGIYTYTAYTQDLAGNHNNSAARTMTIDLALPTLTLYSPLNQTYHTPTIDLNYTSADTYLDTTWYEYNGANTTLTDNTTLNALESQQSTIILWANDSAGNIKSDTILFRVNYIPIMNLSSIAPIPAYTTNDLAGYCNASDADSEDVAYYYTWYKDNATYSSGVTEKLFVNISAGNHHTCGLLSNGSAMCWGRDSDGQLGDGNDDQADEYSPVFVDIGYIFSSISNGEDHTCGILSNGSVMCWGRDSNGQLGDGNDDQVDEYSPVFVDTEYTFSSISAGQYHTCGILINGSAMCWGWDFFGVLGDGDDDQADEYSPVFVDTEYTFSSISIGTVQACGVLTNGSAMCWGYDFYGTLGDGDDDQATEYSPVFVDTSYTFSSISVMLHHSCGVLTNGSAMCWGYDSNGQLGDGNDDQADEYTPVFVDTEYTFDSIFAGWYHTCGVLTNGSAMCWGYDGNGELGDGYPSENKYSPVFVDTEYSFSLISAGMDHTCSVMTIGSVLCWGSDNDGQLGDGDDDEADEYSPVFVDTSMLSDYNDGLLYFQHSEKYLASILPYSATSKGEEWIFECTPYDSLENGTAMNSSTLTLSNTIPIITVTTTDSSDVMNPTNESYNVTFTVTATDADLDTYVLHLCSSDSFTTTCTDTTYCTSTATSSGSQATCQHNTSGEASETYNWFAFVYDGEINSTMNNTNSPYNVNHRPYASDVEINISSPKTTDALNCDYTFNDP